MRSYVKAYLVVDPAQPGLNHFFANEFEQIVEVPGARQPVFIRRFTPKSLFLPNFTAVTMSWWQGFPDNVGHEAERISGTQLLESQLFSIDNYKFHPKN